MTPDLTPFFMPPSPEGDARLTPNTRSMSGSMILGIAGQVRKMQAEGHDICNLTVGDFSPAHFSIPDPLSHLIQKAVADGANNYPPADGIPELREAIVEWYKRDLGLDYPAESVCVGSGARPPIYTAWRLFVEPGDVTVSFLPAWNVGYYAHITESRHRFVPTSAETNFFPTVEQCREAMVDAKLMIINSPLNPTGTAMDSEVMRGIATALVEENARRGWTNGQVGKERPCMLLFDQVYWMLTADGVQHHNPVNLVPESAPFVLHVDAISKCFAATGLRLGWGVVPPAIQPKMKALMGHVGSWAPRPVQVACAEFLRSPVLVDTYMTEMRKQVAVRLNLLHSGIQDMRREGLPINAIAPQGAIYLSLSLDLSALGFETNEEVRRWLLEAAGVAVVPFAAFDLKGETGWFRMSIGAVGVDDLARALERMEVAIRQRMNA